MGLTKDCTCGHGECTVCTLKQMIADYPKRHCSCGRPSCWACNTYKSEAFSIALHLQDQLRVAVDALELARKRIEYLGLCLCLNDVRHDEDNERTYLPKIDAVLEQIKGK